MRDLELIEREGWVLRKEDLPKKCYKCLKRLDSRFYWCYEWEIAYCKKCEREEIKTICDSMQMEHKHFSIIQTEELRKTKKLMGVLL